MIIKTKSHAVIKSAAAALIIAIFLGCAGEVMEPGGDFRIDYIRDYMNAYGRIFDLGRLEGVADYETIDFYSGDSIINIEVYTVGPYYPYEEYTYSEGEFWVNPNDTTQYSEESQRAGARKVDTGDYFYNPTEFWINFERANAGTQYEIGVYMVVKRLNGDIDTIGNIREEPYRLKLIRLRQPTNTMVTWNYEWKNVYSLMRRNISSEVFENLSITVFRGENDTEGDESNRSDQDGVPLNLILGLYKTDTIFADSGWQLNPANIWLEQGLLIFPSRRPFDPYEPVWDHISLSERVPEIYDSNNNIDKVTASEYYFEIRTAR